MSNHASVFRCLDAKAIAKHTPYWHPRYGTADGRGYCPIERKDAAALIRDHKRDKTLSVSTTVHGMRVYRLFAAPDFFWETGYIQMARRSQA